MDFHKYQHVERFGNDEVDGIEIGECYIFPKIDGTNASIWAEDRVDGWTVLKTGSRRRELEIEKDNAGFCEWVRTEQIFAGFFKRNPHLRLYGEWLVPHSLKIYREDAWRDFYVFDVVDESDDGFRYLPYEEYKTLLDECGINYIPPLKIITNPTYDDLLHCLEINNFLIEDGKGTGEGIVIKNYSFKNKYGRVTWAKIVTSEFKEKHSKEMGAPRLDREMFEQEVVDEYVTQALVDKTYAKIALDGWNSKKIPQLFSTVFHDLVVEDMWDIVKKKKYPKIDFKTLNTLTVLKIKELKKELF